MIYSIGMQQLTFSINYTIISKVYNEHSKKYPQNSCFKSNAPTLVKVKIIKISMSLPVFINHKLN